MGQRGAVGKQPVSKSGTQMGVPSNCLQATEGTDVCRAAGPSSPSSAWDSHLTSYYQPSQKSKDGRSQAFACCELCETNSAIFSWTLKAAQARIPHLKRGCGVRRGGDKRRRQSPVGTQPRISLPEWLTAVSLLTLALQTCWTSLKLDQVVCRNVLKARGPPATVMTALPVFSFSLITTPNEQIPLKQEAVIQARIPAFRRWRQEEKKFKKSSVI